MRENVFKSADRNYKKRFSSKKILAIAASVLLIVGVTLGTLASTYYYPNNTTASPESTNSYADIINVIRDYRKAQDAFNINEFLSLKSMSGTVDYDASNEASDGTSGASNDYSTTNLQTDGMDEGDIVKTDGQFIYKLNTKGCFIISAENGVLNSVYTISIDNYVPQEMYISGDKLILIGGIYETYYYGANYQSAQPLMDCMYYISYSKTDIRVYDITQKDAPVLDRQVTVDGNYYTSRIKLDGNKLFYMVNYYFNYYNEDKYIPQITDTELNGGEETTIPAENIYYYSDMLITTI